MISFSNQKMGYENNIKTMPVINFLDSLTITNYGKLREILLDYGKSYTYRMQVVYSTIFIMVII